MASDNSPKEKDEYVQIENIQKVVNKIFTIYRKFYTGSDEDILKSRTDMDIDRPGDRPMNGKKQTTIDQIKKIPQNIKRKISPEKPSKINRPVCKYMQQEVQTAKELEENLANYINGKELDIPDDTMARYDQLAKDLTDRVDRKDFIGSLEKFPTHTLKDFKVNPYSTLSPGVIDAFFSLLGFIPSIPWIHANILFKQVWKSLALLKELSKEGSGIIHDNLKKKKSSQKYEEKEKGGWFNEDFSTKLKGLDDDEARKIFKLMYTVYQCYMPKINVHFDQCYDAYEDLFRDIFKYEKEPEKDNDEIVIVTVDDEKKLKEKVPEFKTCNDLVKFTEKVYRLYHEICKLSQYLMPMLRFMQCIAVQAKIWQEFWDKHHLWETTALIEKLKDFDEDDHMECKFSNLCYGPLKHYTEHGYPTMTRVPNGEVGSNIRIFPGNESKPHHEIGPHIRSPWKDEKKKSNELKSDDTGSENKVEQIEQSRREYILNDKNERIAQFVSVAKKSVDAKEDDDGRRFEALVTDVGLFTEYKGIFKGQWQWTKRYLKPKSWTKTTFKIVVLVVGIGVGAYITGFTAGLATPVAVAIATGWGAGKFLGKKGFGKLVDSGEKKYDRRAIEEGKDWYSGKVSDKKRMRIDRSADASAKVTSHFLSSIKNYKRLNYFRQNGTLSNINNCDELAQYLWSVYKLQHHAYKMVEYNRPMLDFIMTCEKNLERWVNCYNNNIERCMKYCYKFLRDKNHKVCYQSHIISCGKGYRSKEIPQMRQSDMKNEKSNTINIACRKSRLCYGPKRNVLSDPTAAPHEWVRRPLDLHVWKEETKRKKVRLILEKQEEEQEATKEISLDELEIDVVYDDDEDFVILEV